MSSQLFISSIYQLTGYSITSFALFSSECEYIPSFSRKGQNWFNYLILWKELTGIFYNYCYAMD